MKIVDIQYLIKKYGEKTTLKEALEKEQGDYIYVCPKCAGKGIIKDYTVEELEEKFNEEE